MPLSGTGSKRKAIPKEKSDDELPAGIGDDFYLYPLVIGSDLKVDDVSVGNGSINNRTLHVRYIEVVLVP